MKSIAAENNLVNVRGTELLAGDTRELYRQKLARITLDSMVQFVDLLDAKGTVLEINHVALDAVGVKLSEVEGKPFWTTFWWQVSPEINSVLRDSIRRAAQGEFVRWDTEIYGRAGGTETIIIDASLMPVKDVHGKVVFITAEGRDITEKKGYEREIAKKNQDLQALLARVRDLDEIKTQFFANVSHELRTPLQLIIGPADRLSKNDAAMNAEQRQESARVIARNARMLLKHVNDLLDISKFEAGKLKIELKDTDIASLVRLTASHFDVLAADRKIAFRVEAPAGTVSAVDSEKIQRVVMNLLSNAFKFVPDGGAVHAKLQASAGELRVSVEDSGPEIEPELRQAIFERFRQGEGGMNRQFGGTGLGLAIAKEFVEMHQGTIEVHDSALGGACFQMMLPLHRLSPSPAGLPASTDHLERAVVEGFIEELRPAPKRRDQKKSKGRVQNPKPTVLVVEDNPEMNQFLVESLDGDYHVVTAFDGQEGFEKALKSNPALIVTDIMMPRVSGVEMIAQVRKCLELAEVPILLLSAKADEELKIKLLDEGAQDFVAKPFSEKDLLVRVKNLVELTKTKERHRTLLKSMQEAKQELARANAELAKTNEELEQRVEKRTASLRDAIAQMEEFSYTVSHDLRAPLRGMQAYSEVLLEECSEILAAKPEAIEYLKRIGENAVRLDKMVRDVLTFSRIARSELCLERVSVDKLVRELVEHYPAMQPPKAEIHIDPLAEVLGHETSLTQALSNLLTNAVKFVPPGTIPRIRIWTEMRNSDVRIWIEDNGIGIDPRLHHRLFRMFDRVHPDLPYEGTGVGLAVVRKAAERMNGHAGVESDGTNGSRFWIQLPGA